MLEYQILVVEQSRELAFNRGALMNIGYLEALKIADFDCFVFHDVDLIPEDDRIGYKCHDHMVKHLSVAINKHKYKLIYQENFGGVIALTKEQFNQSNGFSNKFFGWGGEDDNFYTRVVNLGFKVFRYPANIARYSMLKHGKVEESKEKDKLVKTQRADIDGLSTLSYAVIKKQAYSTYFWVLVELPKPR